MFNLQKLHREREESIRQQAAQRANKAAEAAASKAKEPKKKAFFEGRAEPKFDITFDANGNSSKVPVEQSPLSLEVVQQLGRGSETMRSVSIGRSEDLIAHKKFMMAEGPRLEAKHGVKAAEIFGGKNSRLASTLMAESPDDYAWLREYHRLTS